MASGRDFTRDAGEGEQDALIGIQTRGGTILRGTTMPPSPNDTAGREGTRRTPGTGRERSPPSGPRKEWPPGLARLTGNQASCAGSTGGSRIATTGGRPEFALLRSRGSPLGFTALATVPTLNLRPEWLSNPRGTPQRTPGENFGHGTQDAGAGQMGAFRPGVRNAPGEENNPALQEK
jgi:hypothetical protein